MKLRPHAIALAATCALAATSFAQLRIVDELPGTFLDIPSTGAPWRCTAG